MSNRRIILASQSPRRKQLLEMIGLTIEVIPSSFKENLDINVSPQELVEYLSFQKAQDIATKHEGAVVIGVDTIIVIDKKPIGKPADKKHAKKILQSISGRSHQVLTGYTIIDTGTSRRKTKVIVSDVEIKELSEKEIDAYIASGEPMDKAGAYGIQGLGSLFVKKIKGDYFNIVGLPLHAFMEDLKEFGIDVFDR